MVPDTPWPSVGSALANFRSAPSAKIGVGLFWKLECSVLRLCFIGNEINTNGARHPMAFCGVCSREFSLGGERENRRGIVLETRV